MSFVAGLRTLRATSEPVGVKVVERQCLRAACNLQSQRDLSCSPVSVDSVG